MSDAVHWMCVEVSWVAAVLVCCLSCSAHVQELHSKVDELEADNDNLNTKIHSFGECNKEKDLAVRNQ